MLHCSSKYELFWFNKISGNSEWNITITKGLNLTQDEIDNSFLERVKISLWSVSCLESRNPPPPPSVYIISTQFYTSKAIFQHLSLFLNVFWLSIKIICLEEIMVLWGKVSSSIRNIPSTEILTYCNNGPTKLFYFYNFQG